MVCHEHLEREDNIFVNRIMIKSVCMLKCENRSSLFKEQNLQLVG